MTLGKGQDQGQGYLAETAFTGVSHSPIITRRIHHVLFTEKVERRLLDSRPLLLAAIASDPVFCHIVHFATSLIGMGETSNDVRIVGSSYLIYSRLPRHPATLS